MGQGFRPGHTKTRIHIFCIPNEARTMTRAFRAWFFIFALLAVAAPSRLPAASELSSADAEKLAQSVTIQRDEWGVPHIYGPTDAATSFGLAYAQAEDFF